MFNLCQPAISSFLTRLHEASPEPVRPGNPPPPSTVEQLFDLGADHHISALFAVFLASRAAAFAAQEFLDQLEEAVDEPEVPEVLHVREDDAAWFLPCRVPETAPSGEHFYFHPTDVERLQKTAHQLYDVTDAQGHPTPAELRRREIVEAHRLWWEDRGEVRRQSGIADAIERERKGSEHYRKSLCDLARAQPTTLEGALLKVRAVAAIAESEDDLLDWHREEGVGGMSGLAISLTVDLIRLLGLLMPAGEVAA